MDTANAWAGRAVNHRRGGRHLGLNRKSDMDWFPPKSTDGIYGTFTRPVRCYYSSLEVRKLVTTEYMMHAAVGHVRNTNAHCPSGFLLGQNRSPNNCQADPPQEDPTTTIDRRKVGRIHILVPDRLILKTCTTLTPSTAAANKSAKTETITIPERVSRTVLNTGIKITRLRNRYIPINETTGTSTC